MAEPTLDDVGKWILDNQDKAGTPEFVTMSDAYRQMSGMQQATQPSLWQRTKEWLIPPVPKGLGPTPDITEVRRALDPDPYSAGNTADRILTSTMTAIPDTSIALYNAAARGVGRPEAQVDYLAPQMRAKAGTQELSADAPLYRRFSEAAASALLGGGRGVSSALQAGRVGQAATRLGSDVLAPTAASMAGGEIGGRYGGETGALLGSLAGGMTPNTLANAGRVGVRNWYAGYGRPDAAAIEAASQRAGITSTPGMLGNPAIQDLEASLQRRPGAQNLIEGARMQARDQMVAALDRVANQRGAVTSSPSVIGDMAQQTAEQTAEGLSARSSAAQQRLIDRIGPQAPTDVSNVLATLENIRQRTDPETFAPIDRRVAALRQMLPVDEEGNIVATDVPYERLKDWRTNLRMRGANLDPVPQRYAGEIYNAATGSMGAAAEAAGVPRQDFLNTQQQTRAVEGPGGFNEALRAISDRDPKAAYNYLLRGGEQNPERLTYFDAATRGDPRTGAIMGSHLRRIIDETLRKNAPGAFNLAERVQTMHPSALETIAGGPQAAQQVQDVATAARAYHRPTTQGGAGKMVSDVASRAAEHGVSALGGGAVGHALGLPWYLTAPVGYLGPHAIDRARASMLLSPSARAGLLGQPTPLQPWSTNQMLSSIAAMNAAQGYGNALP